MSESRRQVEEGCELVENPLSKFGCRLGRSVRDIQWRLLNARIAAAYIRKESTEEVIEHARRAVRIAPYALDVKANLGVLLMYQAAGETGEKQKELLSEARGIFAELGETGWDPGFVHYRLAQLDRVAGDFADAQRHAVIASRPDMRDVHRSLDRELDLIARKDQSFSKDTI